MTSKLEALATDVALLAVAFSVRNPSPKEKTFVVWREKKSRRLMLAEEES